MPMNQARVPVPRLHCLNLANKPPGDKLAHFDVSFSTAAIPS